MTTTESWVIRSLFATADAIGQLSLQDAHHFDDDMLARSRQSRAFEYRARHSIGTFRECSRHFAEHPFDRTVQLLQFLLECNAVGAIDFLIELHDLVPQQIAKRQRIISAEFDLHRVPRDFC
jgi:hypothetical protein